MCVMSMVGDYYTKKWPDEYTWIKPLIESTQTGWSYPQVTKTEFDALKKEVVDMKELLKKAKIYDEKNNEPNCEMEDKVALLKKVAELVGVSLEEVFK